MSETGLYSLFMATKPDTQEFKFQVIPVEGQPFNSKLVTVQVRDDGSRDWCDIVDEAEEKAHQRGLKMCAGFDFDIVEV